MAPELKPICFSHVSGECLRRVVVVAGTTADAVEQGHEADEARGYSRKRRSGERCPDSR